MASLLDNLTRAVDFVDGLLLRARATQDDSQPRQDRNKGIVIAMCIVISFLLWFSISMGKTYSTSVQMAIEVEGLSDSTALAAVPPSEIQVQVRGEGWQLLPMVLKDFPIQLVPTNNNVDLREAVERLSNLPAGVQIQRVSPIEFSWLIDQRIHRRIPVAIKVNITPDNLYQHTISPTVFPDSIDIFGAASILESIVEWPTITEKWDRIQEPTTQTVQLLDTLNGLVQTNVTEVDITANVEFFTEKQLQVPVTTDGAPAGSVELLTDRVTVSFSLPLSQYELVSPDDFDVFVSYSDIQSDTTGSVTIRVTPPLNGTIVRNLRVTPRRIGYYYFTTQN